MKTFFTNLYWKFYTWSTQSNLRAILVGALIVILFAAIGLTPWFISLAVPSFWWGFALSIGIFGAGILSVFIWLIYNSIKS